MGRELTNLHFRRVDALISLSDRFAPANMRGVESFRGELAGLIVVSMAASYENCVKEIMNDYASRRHNDFHHFIDKNYKRMNSRVKISDLHKYTKLFGPQIHTNFKDALHRRKTLLQQRSNVNICSSYEQVLDWRHDYAHAGLINTTVEEATKFHMFGKRVIYTFAEAFSDLAA